MSLFLILSSGKIKASETEYGICNSWIKLEDNEWQKTPVKNVSLDIYEPFYIKAKITTKLECRVALELVGAGFTKTFEVIQGPSKYNEAICYSEKPKGWNETFQWKLRPTDNKFAGGTTPLKLYVQYKKRYDDWHSEYEYDKKYEYVRLLSPHINKTFWEEYQDESIFNTQDATNQKNTVGNKTPGFEILSFLIAAFLVFIFRRKEN